MTAFRLRDTVRPAFCLGVMLVWSLPALAAESEEATLRILSLNVWHGLRSGEGRMKFPGEDPERRERRLSWQIEQIRQADPDVLLLQEVNPNQRLSRRYAEALGYDEIHKVTSCGLHLGAILKIPGNMNEGLAILARPKLELRSLGHIRLSGNAKCAASLGFQTRESRYALFGVVQFQGRSVLLATTHLSAPPFVPEGFEGRIADFVRDGQITAEQRAELSERLDAGRLRNLAEARAMLEGVETRRRKLGAEEVVPVVLAGDFNSEPGAASIKAVEDAGFRNAGTGRDYLTWDPVTNRENYTIGSRRTESLPTFEVSEIDQLLKQRATTPRQIDFVFSGGGLEPAGVMMVMNEPQDGILPSDHFGLLVDLRFSSGFTD